MAVSVWGWQLRMTDILVLGESGQVAQALRRMLPGDGSVAFAGRALADLTRPKTIEALLAIERPRVVINAAAYTAVDRAESEPEIARLVNAIAPYAAARAAAAIDAAFIQYSTDYVFDGEADRPYTEDDPTAPLGVYGRTKLEGEVAVSEANARHVILRTSGVFGADGANFVKTMLKLACERDAVEVVHDQGGRPTFADDLAWVGATVARRLMSGGGTGFHGVFHAAGSRDANWYDFAQEIMIQSARRGGPSCAVRAIAGADYRTAARRPRDSRLDSGRLAAVYGIQPGSWRDGLAVTLDRLLTEPRQTGVT